MEISFTFEIRVSAVSGRFELLTSGMKTVSVAFEMPEEFESPHWMEGFDWEDFF
jgi:hypothetical protein